MTTPTTIRVSICKLYPGEKLPTGDNRWGKHTAGFKPQEVTIDELIEAIGAGYAFSAEMKDGYRVGKNFLSAQHLALDFDTEDEQSSFDVLEQDPFISKYSAFMYTSHSHTPEKPRARVVFVLDQPVTDRGLYQKYAEALVKQYALSDAQCKDAARQWYGSKNCYVMEMGGVLPVKVLQTLLKTQALVQPAKESFKMPDVLPDGTRNDTLFRLACSLQAKGLSDEAILEAVSIENELKGNPPKDDDEVDAIVISALRYPKGAGASLQVGTDADNANYFVSKHGEDLLWCEALKSWLVWDEKHWKRSACLEVEILAEDVARDLLVMASTVSKSEAERLAKAGYALLSQSKLANMIEASKRKVSIEERELDCDKGFLTVSNGVIDLKNGDLLPFDRERLTTRMSRTEYNPKATCPKWFAFLDMIMEGNEDEIQWLQKAVGYSLTGYGDSKTLPFLIGDGYNGKSTFLKTIEVLAGDYAQKISTGALTARFQDYEQKNTPYTVLLKGARLVCGDELPPNVVLNASAIKDWTGGDDLTGMAKYEAPITFSPSHLLWLYGNHRPTIKDDSDAIWGRIKTVNFGFTIPEEYRRPMVQVIDEFRQEMSGILNWAVEGAMDAIDKGIGTTAAIKRATNEYRTEEDIVGRWLGENCTMHPGARVEKKAAYANFNRWCENEGVRYPITAKALTRRLDPLGIKLGGHGNMSYVGMELGQGR